MKTVIWNDLNEIQKADILKRPSSADARAERESVRGILDDVRDKGMDAVRAWTKRFDQYDPVPLYLSGTEIDAAVKSLSFELKSAMDAAYTNIKNFHVRQGYRSFEVETAPGLHCARMVVPVERIGLYIPGGTAPLLSTVLMLGVPSQIAGNPQRVLCTPADKDSKIHPAILYAARLCGIESIARIGGAQAIAAMAYGMPELPRVDKIFGPGNIYVTLAKTLVAQESGGPAIDMPAGPSEVLVIADAQTPPAFAAADLLSQAEHDVASQVVLVATNEKVVEDILREIDIQIKTLPRASIACKALEGSLAIVVESMDQAIAVSNQYAPEHLILCIDKAERYRGAVKNAGSVFGGTQTPESLGDYASGTNHVLPTSAAARAYSGLSVESFQKTITWQTATREGLQGIGPSVMAMAEAETLDAHARAVGLRLGNDKP